MIDFFDGWLMGRMKIEEGVAFSIIFELLPSLALTARRFCFLPANLDSRTNLIHFYLRVVGKAVMVG